MSNKISDSRGNRRVALPKKRNFSLFSLKADRAARQLLSRAKLKNNHVLLANNFSLPQISPPPLLIGRKEAPLVAAGAQKSARERFSRHRYPTAGNNRDAVNERRIQMRSR